MVQTEEGWHTLPDGVKLYTKTWIPSGPPTAHLIFLHGFSDHINAYYDLFPTLSSPPYSLQIHGFDQRGWGRSVTSPTTAGLTGPTSTVLSDIRSFIRSLSLPPSTPIFLMGHSMGGAEALSFLLSTSPSYTSAPLPKISGLILESPYIALHPSSQPSPVTVSLGKLAGRLLPSRQLKQKLDATYMSRSATVRQDWVDDPLCHDTGTLAGLAGMLSRAADLVSLSSTTHPASVAHLTAMLPCPLLLCHGTEDRVTSYPASRALFEQLQGEKRFQSYEGGYHKLHAEPEGMAEEFARDVGGWILSTCQEGQKEEEGGKEQVAGEGMGQQGREQKL